MELTPRSPYGDKGKSCTDYSVGVTAAVSRPKCTYLIGRRKHNEKPTYNAESSLLEKSSFVFPYIYKHYTTAFQ